MLNSELAVVVRTTRDALVLEVRGVVDSTTVGQLETIVREAIAKGRRQFIFNLSEASYITSVGWGVFIANLKWLREREGDIQVCGMPPSIEAIYSLMGMERVIDAWPDEPAALRAFQHN